MGGIRKNKRRKVYLYDKNRKRMNKKVLHKIKCKIVDEHWTNKMTVEKNLKQMGLVYDLNSAISNPQARIVPENPPLKDVAEKLEEEARAPREKLFRITKNAVAFATYMLDKYDQDYKAMAKDKKNILQLTWKQIRAKLNMFKSIPEQYNKYLEKKKAVKTSQ